jgi:hypothetical protein
MVRQLQARAHLDLSDINSNLSNLWRRTMVTVTMLQNSMSLEGS